MANAKRWLLKTDPRSLTFDDLVQRRVVTWRGVSQRLSLSHLRKMRRGDEVLVYHAGNERRVVGTAKVRKGAYADPEDPEGTVVDVAPVGALARPVSLAELKAVASLARWELVRIPRIHVMPVPAAAWRKVLSLSRR
jgi:predicted RNA-binding protein with PUA-like domain